MSRRYDGLLARVLAAENLTVTHDAKATTASFDTANRILHLPILKNMGGHSYDAFIGHEVSHALHTPRDWFKSADENTCPDVYLNVVEDIRVDRLIMDRFNGLIVDYIMFRKDIVANDFLKMKDRKVDEMLLIDKVNVLTKAPKQYDIPLNPIEEALFGEALAVRTYDDVVEVAKKIFAYDKKQWKELQEKMKEMMNDLINSLKEQWEKLTPEQQQEILDRAPDTQDAYGSSMETLVIDKEATLDPQTQAKTSAGQKFGDKSSENPMKKGGKGLPPRTSMGFSFKNPSIHRPHPQHDSFVGSVRKVVGNMVVRFNMRKAAVEYSRTKTGRSGEVNPKKLSSYKFVEDIFLKTEEAYTAKNHGFFFLIDVSGSMSDSKDAIVRQLTIFCHFCAALNIPVIVHTFTSGTYSEVYNSYDTRLRGKMDKTASMWHIFDNINMSGTPLYQAINYSEEFLKQFRYGSNVQKMAYIIITDGEGDYTGFNKMIVTDQDNSKNHTVRGRMAPYDYINFMKDKYSLSKTVGIFISKESTTNIMKTLNPTEDKGLQKKNNEEADQVAFKRNGYNRFTHEVMDDYFIVDISSYKNLDANRLSIFNTLLIDKIA